MDDARSIASQSVAVFDDIAATMQFAQDITPRLSTIFAELESTATTAAHNFVKNARGDAMVGVPLTDGESTPGFPAGEAVRGEFKFRHLETVT